MLICLDSGCLDYEHWCITTTLRGLCAFELEVEVLKESIHSGLGSGIVPDSFRIARNLLEQFEDSRTGRMPDFMYADIP